MKFPQADVEFFRKSVEPILSQRCYKCHSHQAKKSSGSLMVDGRSALLEGGDTGPAIVPGKPDESLLIRAIQYNDADYQMPPGGKKIPDEEIAVLVDWVRRGAPWTDENPLRVGRRKGELSEEDRKWWAIQPLAAVTPPDAGPANWIRNEIDRFIWQRLDREGLSPTAEADRRTLIRRLSYDLRGLPPTVDEIDTFLADQSSDAYEKLVDRMLASEQYGERWARFWLDLVRYAESDGYRLDEFRPDAWRYRDYVIRAFNDDKPYDRFVQEQLAGDELFPANNEARIATGYYRQGIYEYNLRDARGQWGSILNDITDTTADVFLGLGLQCARCHDHKFDPLLQKDYYRLQAFFSAYLPQENTIVATADEQAAFRTQQAKWEEATAEIRKELASLEEPYREKAANDSISRFPAEIQTMIRKPVPERLPQEHQLAELAYRQVLYEFTRLDSRLKGADKEKIFALRKQLSAFDSLKPVPLATALTATDVGKAGAPTVIPKKKDSIAPGIPTILKADPAEVTPFENTSGQRAALAKWITSPENALTARVYVNRIWQRHFGRGLAVNTSDFGRLGDAPSHPELLDWLARKFIDLGFKTKPLHKLIVTSATYRQGSQVVRSESAGPSKAELVDPENRLLWRWSVQRMESEAIRDSLLAASRELKLTGGGPSGTGDLRRAVYQRVLRNTRDSLNDVFDAPLWIQSASSRDTTTTPVQSLYMINGQFVLLRAKTLGASLVSKFPDESQRIDELYRQVYGRLPRAEEKVRAIEFLKHQRYVIDPRESTSQEAAFLYDKIPYRDGQAAQITPMGAQPWFEASGSELPAGDFTIEAFFLLRSVSQSGAVRTIAATGLGSKEPGWGFGVTGKASRRKPQTLVLQIFGDLTTGKPGEQAIFSDQHIELNKPYYAAASLRLAKGMEAGEVTFFLKDLSNDDEPLLKARVSHQLTGGYANKSNLKLGGRGNEREHSFDGLLDGVRLSRGALTEPELLFTAENSSTQTVGYWPFEQEPSALSDRSGNGHDLKPASRSAGATSNPSHQAFIDLAHVLLNSNEFLYIE